ncbi:MAG: IclR family transcriptional regulator [Burkholderiaceae bacterium]|nr:MAG: IclR family transcriptional regulator [Burkholderiaceae bacterium]TAM02538.1 MAG: IclR family transcriptional regulator [Pusillimonas sp.]
MINLAAARGRPRRKSNQPVGIQTVETALDVLSIITQEGFPIGLSELSRKSGLIPSKLHRYLVTLVRYGIVKQSIANGMYDLGPTALRIGLAALSRHDFISSAQDIVGALAANTESTVALYVWTELGPTLVRMEMRSPPLTTLRVGTALPLVGSATGRVFLAHLPMSETARLLRKERAAAKTDGIAFPTLREINSTLDAIRDSEIYWTRDAIIQNTVGVIPILRRKQDPLCVIIAILPSGHAGPSQRERVGEQLLAARDILQKECGFDIEESARSLRTTDSKTREVQSQLDKAVSNIKRGKGK